MTKIKQLFPEDSMAQKGFTLIELLITIVIVAFVIISIAAVIFFVGWGCEACQKVDERTEKITYSECVESCAQLEGEEAEAECMKRCE